MRENICAPIHVFQLTISDDIYEDEVSGFYVFVSKINIHKTYILYKNIFLHNNKLETPNFEKQ